jgi:hypothetical protein
MKKVWISIIIIFAAIVAHSEKTNCQLAGHWFLETPFFGLWVEFEENSEDTGLIYRAKNTSRERIGRYQKFKNSEAPEPIVKMWLYVGKYETNLTTDFFQGCRVIGNGEAAIIIDIERDIKRNVIPFRFELRRNVTR